MLSEISSGRPARLSENSALSPAHMTSPYRLQNVGQLLESNSCEHCNWGQYRFVFYGCGVSSNVVKGTGRSYWGVLRCSAAEPSTVCLQIPLRFTTVYRTAQEVRVSLAAAERLPHNLERNIPEIVKRAGRRCPRPGPLSLLLEPFRNFIITESGIRVQCGGSNFLRDPFPHFQCNKFSASHNACTGRIAHAIIWIIHEGFCVCGCVSLRTWCDDGGKQKQYEEVVHLLLPFLGGGCLI
jgi:hypothetical protein